MKKLLVVTAIAAMGSTTVTNAADVVDSQVIDSAIAFVLTKASLTYASKHHVARKLLQYR